MLAAAWLAASVLATPTLGPELTVGPGGRGQAAGAQNRARLASNTVNILAVWNDGRRTPNQVWAARIDFSASLLDPAGIEVTRGAEVASEITVAWGGSSAGGFYLVSYIASGTLFVRRIRQNGTLIDPGPTAVGPASQAAVASDGDGFMVLYFDGSVINQRIAADLTLATPRTMSNSSCAGLDIAFSGANYLTAWGTGGSSSNVVAARVTPLGVTLDLPVVVVFGGPGQQVLPKVAPNSDGSWTLAAITGSSPNFAITTVRFSATATLSGSFVTSAPIVPAGDTPGLAEPVNENETAWFNI